MSTTSSPRETSARDLASVFLAAAAFAVSGPVAKVIDTVHPIAVASARTGLAALALFLLDGPAIADAWKRAPVAEWRRAFGAGVLLAAHFAAYLGGLQATSLAAASAFISLEPVAVVAVASIAQRIHPRGVEVPGVLLATLGALLVGAAAGNGEHRLGGDLLVVASVVFYGLYVAVARGVDAALPRRAYAAFVYAAASLVLVPLVALTPSAHRWPSPRDCAGVLALALLPTLVGHTLIQSAAARVRPAVLALVSPGETLGSIAIGACMLHVFPSSIEWVGIAVLLAGATLVAGASRGP